MRFVWSFVLATGLLLVGFEVYEGRRAERTRGKTTTEAVSALEDGTEMPPPPPADDRQ